MARQVRRVAVLGGGMTGLSAAFYLLKLAKERGEKLEVTVIEGSDRLGGMVNTLRKDGFVIERGPDSFLARKLPMIELARELGIDGDLTGTNPQAKKTYISMDGRLHPMPEGLTLGIPSDREKFMRTDLVSEEGKMRALEDLDIPAGDLAGDETVGRFLERRMGKEMVERIFEPLLAGIHAGDLYHLGLQATFPQFKQMVGEHGSLIAGTREAQLAAAKARAKTEADAQEGAGVGANAGETVLPPSVFLTFRNGLSTVIEALESRLIAEGCIIRLGAQAESLERISPEREEGYRLQLADGSFVEADEVLFTLPAYGTAELLSPHVDVSAMTNIRYISVANVVLAYDEAGFKHNLDGSGFLIPRGEHRQITASTWTSAKWLHTAPNGKRLIRCYVGRAGDEKGVELNDAVLAGVVQRDLQDLMGLTATPEFVEITRLRHSMPQYPVGHVDAIASFRQGLSERLPGVFATGAAFGGVGLPDCVAQGKQAAEEILGC
ncbi:protoporphyrinogen oxidase [Cohnella cholangitidis]|uniref:Coproporphyrinogen III oxidase n=1 Tax=Cohnella cholangitidis TaxID=2598458 RepID=A0A7G5BUE8_9BACL|nr:protoporphyrinogen oxidase [Cohnella cholangitidis]QMV40582.1 protoporphyrinogen oxidase [Cohnella cholangitidis]